MIQKDNKWWYWGKGKGTHTCCDCGLVHDVVMQVTKDKMIKTKWSRREDCKQENKYHFAREIIFNLKSCHAINEKVYLHWIDKLISDEKAEKSEQKAE